MAAGNCNRCGVYRRWLHGHHIVPRSEGGSDEPDNIERICANCHEDAHGSPFGNLIRAARRRAAREAAVPKELLEKLYVEEGLSMQEVGNRLGVAKSTVHYWLDDYGIDRRKGGAPSKKPDRETLVRLYLREKQPLEAIAAALGVSREAVRLWCRQAGIPLRSRTDAMRLRAGLTEDEVSARERIRGERAERRKRYQISEAELRRLYVDDGLSCQVIADMKGVSVGLVWKRLKAFGVATRPAGWPQKQIGSDQAAS